MLHLVALLSLLLAFACALLITIDELRHPQSMAIMNIVWPITALYAGPFALWAYYVKGRTLAQDAPKPDAPKPPAHSSHNNTTPTLPQTALAASHCGAGCVLADILTESTLFALGTTLLGSELYASYAWDLLTAWLLGIAFQYFSIQPMRHLPAAQALWQAVKADTLSILAFQVGMYSWMALVFFRLFPHPHLHPNQLPYWFMMQIAMLCGFGTALPVNWLLVRTGLKEAMG